MDTLRVQQTFFQKYIGVQMNKEMQNKEGNVKWFNRAQFILFSQDFFARWFTVSRTPPSKWFTTFAYLIHYFRFLCYTSNDHIRLAHCIHKISKTKEFQDDTIMVGRSRRRLPKRDDALYTGCSSLTTWKSMSCTRSRNSETTCCAVGDRPFASKELIEGYIC